MRRSFQQGCRKSTETVARVAHSRCQSLRSHYPGGCWASPRWALPGKCADGGTKQKGAAGEDAPECCNADYLRRRKSISVTAPRPASAKEEGSGINNVNVIPPNVLFRFTGIPGGVAPGLPVAVMAMADSQNKFWPAFHPAMAASAVAALPVQPMRKYSAFAPSPMLLIV